MRVKSVSLSSNLRSSDHLDARGRVAFIENKLLNFRRIEELLTICARQNHWANRGPLYEKLTAAYGAHLNLSEKLALVPVANGAIALEAMARQHDAMAGRRLKWLGSAFSFKNLGRGYFSSMKFLDCDSKGLLDLRALRATDSAIYDGIVLTNPFGLYDDFSEYTRFAQQSGKALLIDNASGLRRRIPDLPWQAFSLHQTKPYGVGEGGLALVPRHLAEDIYEAVSYGDAGDGSQHWLQNGKISDISCAFLIARLEASKNWLPQYYEQRERVLGLARTAGLQPLAEPSDDHPLTSLPLIAEAEISHDAVKATQSMTLGKYYTPLASLPTIRRLFSRLVNIPCHPDMAALTDHAICDDIERCLEHSATPVCRENGLLD